MCAVLPQTNAAEAQNRNWRSRLWLVLVADYSALSLLGSTDEPVRQFSASIFPPVHLLLKFLFLVVVLASSELDSSWREETAGDQHRRKGPSCSRVDSVSTGNAREYFCQSSPLLRKPLRILCLASCELWRQLRRALMGNSAASATRLAGSWE